MKEKVFILYIGMILLVGGCYDDKGNYDYTDIGDITITGIENSYTAIALAKKLEIKPTVRISLDGLQSELLRLLSDGSNKSGYNRQGERSLL